MSRASSLAQVAILAGGMGTRLKTRTGKLPKPMAPILGRPILEHQIELCRRHGFTKIALLVHYEHEAISNHFGDGSRWGVNLCYRVETTARGTAGALRDALDVMDARFLVLYADTYLDVNLRKFWDAHADAGPNTIGTLFLHPNDHPQDSDLVEMDSAGRILRMYPYPHPPELSCRNLVNAALYVLDRDALGAMIPEVGKVDLAKHTFTSLLAAGQRLEAYVSPEYIKDMGTPERLDKVERDIRHGLPERLSDRQLRTAVFFDRDGTLNREVGHLRSDGQLELLPGAAQAVRQINREGMLSVVITNQPVVARGEVDLPTLSRIHARLESLLGLEHAYIDRLYFCPHHPDRGFENEVQELKIACRCRKPSPGLIEAACRDLQIRASESWVVGDMASDIEAGRAAGCRTILVRTGHAGANSPLPMRPDYVMPDVLAATDWILRGHAETKRRLASVATAAIDARLVLVGGLARSGKSVAAQALKELLAGFGRAAHVVSLDSWLKPAEDRSEGSGVMSRFDAVGLANALHPLTDASDRITLALPIYDRARRSMHARPIELSIGPEDAIIVEGVPALMIDSLRERAKVRVFMDLPEAQRLARLKTDYEWRGHRDAAVLEALLRSRSLDESEPVTASASFAQFQLSSAAPE